MATKADFTTEEWSQIQRAPFMAGLAVVAASPSGPFGVVKEMFAVGRMLGEVKAQGSSNELIKALVADIEAGARDLSAPAELKGKTPEQVKSYAIESLRQVAALLEKKAKPDEAQGFQPVAGRCGAESCGGRQGRRIPWLRRHASKRARSRDHQGLVDDSRG